MTTVTGLLLALSWTGSCVSQHQHGHSHLEPRAAATDCSLYQVSGQSATPFENYRFLDFRSLSNYTASEPAEITTQQDSGEEAVTSPYFNSSTFEDVFQILSGVRNPDSNPPMIYSAQNAYISAAESADGSDTYLTVRTSRNKDFQSVAQMRSVESVLHASMRICMKVLEDSNDTVAAGAVVGFFTYKSDTQETDIEILTKRSHHQFQVTNQPSTTEPAGTSNVSLATGKNWTDWAEYRVDWLQGQTIWYIDDVLGYQTTNSVPTEASALMLNLWSNGGSFSGNMSVGAQVRIAVQYIEMVYNTTDDATSGGTATRCNVDGVETKGEPQVVQTSAAVVTTCIASSTFFFGLVVPLLYVLIDL
ncbi:concanavalin A-like lectin/glucanase domain-containing protein [Exophiala viscosa]|uniref:Concanavalin A-like lectin/glucanase domain-containing protein n=1 Tax=Exophiala viscosa TaxID=2486360 RepID=A0AAN6DT17_9EURO|nr:concanavalin A-like lectin/glucanase domain-containing protein [Exophiala viscosa]KAI1622999.1 concanavalin A-like lectin/glucanase domain-containing protein [Exophiala viscosa]